jgi:predicted ribosomally synthesized peptide with nif11-like leader
MMSRADLERFLGDVRKQPDLLDEIKRAAHNAGAALHWAGERGYAMTPEEIAEVAGADQELSDDDLEQVAGGDDAWGSGGTTPPPTTTGG